MSKYYIVERYKDRTFKRMRIRLAVTGTDWTLKDKEDLYEYSGVISTGYRDGGGLALYSIYEMSEGYLSHFIGDDCIEIKDKEQFNLLAKLCQVKGFRI